MLHVFLMLIASANADNPATSLFKQAETSLAHGDAGGALSLVQQGLAADPRSIPGLNLLGIVYEQQGESEKAEDAFLKALMIDPSSTKTHDNLGMSYLLRGRMERAGAEFRASLQLNPRDNAANYGLGKLLLEKNQALASITYFERVSPQTAQSSFALLQALLRAKQTQRGLKVGKALSDSAPDDARVHFSLGVEFASSKLYPAAIEEFQQADALVPNTFEVLHNLGEAYLRNGDDSSAEPVLQKAADLQPHSVGTLLLLAETEADRREFLQAIEVCRRVRNIRPDSPDVLLLLARIAMAEDLDENAASLLNEAIRFNPERPDIHAALGECDLKLGKTNLAVAELKTVIHLHPSVEALSYLGEASVETGNLADAKSYLKRALAMDPQNASSLYQLGLIASKEGRTEEAEKLFASALHSDPNHDNALFELATLKMRDHKYAEAIPLLHRCAQDMKLPKVFYKLATAERALKDNDHAIADMQTFEALSKAEENEITPLREALQAASKAP